jgi:hypothetical protein
MPIYRQVRGKSTFQLEKFCCREKGKDLFLPWSPMRKKIFILPWIGLPGSLGIFFNLYALFSLKECLPGMLFSLCLKPVDILVTAPYPMFTTCLQSLLYTVRPVLPSWGWEDGV